MPRGNRTGPTGMGPMTGRAAGYCAGANVPGYANPATGGGRNRASFGGGRGCRNRFRATGLPGWQRTGWDGMSYGYPTPNLTPDPKLEKRALKSQAEALQLELDAIKRRLDEIETQTPGN
jgi:Family of unknown function (DUF5320)